MKNNFDNNTDDLELRRILSTSVAPRSEEEQEEFGNRVMRSLPSRRSRSLVHIVMAYVKSPLWTLTGIIVLTLMFRTELTDAITGNGSEMSDFGFVLIFSLAIILATLKMLADVRAQFHI